MEEEEGGIEQQYYSLRWKSHSSNLKSNFQQYLEQSCLTDVSLVCDGEAFKAHQAVLSACSPYFENIFVGHPCPHPIVFMMGVKESEIRAIIEFLYRGSCTVSQSCLQDFLKVADALQIKGLMSDESEYEDIDKMEHQNESEKFLECQHHDEIINKEKLTDNPDDDSGKSNGDTEKTGGDKQKFDAGSSNNQNQQPTYSALNSHVSKLKSGEISYFNSSSKAGSPIQTSQDVGIKIKSKRKYAKTGSSNANSMNNSNMEELDSDSTTDEGYTVGYYLDAVSLPETPEVDLEQEEGSNNEIAVLEDGIIKNLNITDDIERGNGEIESSSHDGDYDFASFPEVQIEPLIEVINLDEDGTTGDNDNNDDRENQSIQTLNNADDEHDNVVIKDDDDNDGIVDNNDDDDDDYETEDKRRNAFYNMIQKAVATTPTKTTTMKRRRSSAFQILAMDDYEFTLSSKPHIISASKTKKKMSTTIMKKKKTVGHINGMLSNSSNVFDGTIYNGSSSTTSVIANKAQKKMFSRKPRKKNNKKGTMSNKPRLPCSICLRTFKNKNVLYNHRSVYHRKGRG